MKDNSARAEALARRVPSPPPREP